MARQGAAASSAPSGSNTAPAHARHRPEQTLRSWRKHLDEAAHQLSGRRAGELVAEELRAAQQALGEITGEFSSDDLLGRIFCSFCVGK